ncbi:MAG: ER membrane protein DP1/Yop1 [Bathelium mastoideum]|nr:MAG: ER membrane protein DP1/Yop1 [Bathelium mastoideum]
MASQQGGASYPEQIQHHISQLDKELSKYPALNNLEKQTTVPKVYAVLGLAAIYLFLIIFNLGSAFLVNIAGFVIPGYYSLEALFTSGKSDDTQWLTYWVVFAFFTVIESAFNATYWFRESSPNLTRLVDADKTAFYYTFKFVLVLWMALPQTGGAQIIFRSLIQPLFARFFTGNGSASPDLPSIADRAGVEKPHGQ